MEDNYENECPICLQKIELPVKLPCSHTFCFLCLKGIRSGASPQKKCALCRVAFSLDAIEQNTAVPEETPSEEESEGYWYYSGKSGHGWWKYDARTSKDIETAYSDGESDVHIVIAGYAYRIFFQQMIQVRTADPTRHRKVKRETNDSSAKNLDLKGIAGLKISQEPSIDQAMSSLSLQ